MQPSVVGKATIIVWPAVCTKKGLRQQLQMVALCFWTCCIRSAVCGAQESGAVGGPAPVTAEELEAIMKGGSQQPKQRRKKQKTDPSARDFGRSLSPAPRLTPEPTALAVEGMHDQQQHGKATDHVSGVACNGSCR